MRRLLVTFGLALPLLLLNGGTAGARDASRPPSPPTTSAILTASTTSSAASPLLPGAQTWSAGASSYDFGTNDTVDYGTPNVDTLPAVQADMKAGGLTLMRLWSYGGDTEAYVESKVKAAKAVGATCLFMLGETDSLKWLEKTIGWTDSYCHLYEFGNEPDNGSGNPNNGKFAEYTQQWLSYVPTLRAMFPGILIGGPTLACSCGYDGSIGKSPEDIDYFLTKTAAAGVRANFITYHDYPCLKATTSAGCVSMTDGDFQWNWNNVITAEKKYYGAPIPTGITEYNFDPGSNNLYSWGDDGPFMTHWTTTAVDEVVTLGMSFAVQFTSMNQAGYSYLDMFSDSAPYGPKPQFNAMVSEIRKYKPLSTQILVPSSGATLSGTAGLDALAQGPSTVTGVSFDISGGSLSKPVVVKAVATLYGWLARWNTTTVANGTYSLQSVATGTGGGTATSKKITVTVRNTA